MLVEIRIHELIWTRTPSHRRREWQQLIAEVMESRPADSDAHYDLIITPHPSADTDLHFRSQDGTEGSELRLSFEVLGPHFREYCDICRRLSSLDEGPLSSRLQALDMGKKVAHDSAARTLSTLTPQFAHHATARCFFSLLVSLHFDSSLLLRGHEMP